MSWNESSGVVSHAFDDWKQTDSEIRAYLETARTWVESAYASAEKEADEEFSASFDPDVDDPGWGPVGLYLEKAGGLWPSDFFWMLRSGALRDAVTAYEVYLEKAVEEVLKGRRYEAEGGEILRPVATVSRNHLSPSWTTLKQIHEALGSTVDPAPVEYVRELRHFLSHQRGELRSRELRDRYAHEGDPEDWHVGEVASPRSGVHPFLESGWFDPVSVDVAGHRGVAARADG
ncbi:hypothetical protein ACK280_19870, partial [Mycobacterium sherrisii]|uniref:hypothetical protein n=1 Tax=Mycobacterium sherrisii TaxID=243061 RepID=UPI003975CEB9